MVTAGTALTELIPFSELSQGQAAAIRTQVRDNVIQTALTQAKVSADRLVVRDIRPSADLGYTVEDWSLVTGATANAYETMASGTGATDRWIAIYGVKTRPDALTASMLKFTIGGGDRAIWTLQQLSQEDDYIGISPTGIIIPALSPYVISRWVRVAKSASFIVMKGFVVETRGKVISP
jgi:hypothetical protein